MQVLGLSAETLGGERCIGGEEVGGGGEGRRARSKKTARGGRGAHVGRMWQRAGMGRQEGGEFLGSPDIPASRCRPTNEP